MNMAICTVFSGRMDYMAEVGDSLAAIDWPTGRVHYVWMANGMDDAGVDILRARAIRLAARGRPVTFIKCPRMLPISIAYNRTLIEAAKQDSEVICEIQDDVAVQPGTLMHLFDSPFDLAGGWRAGKPKVYHFGAAHYVSGMCTLIRRKVFETIGYHCELLLRSVDMDYGIRAGATGFDVGVVEAAKVVHLGVEPVELYEAKRAGAGADVIHAAMIRSLLHDNARRVVHYLERHNVYHHYWPTGWDKTRGNLRWHVPNDKDIVTEMEEICP